MYCHAVNNKMQLIFKHQNHLNSIKVLNSVGSIKNMQKSKKRLIKTVINLVELRDVFGRRWLLHNQGLWDVETALAANGASD